MMTFLPYPSFKRSVRTLDWRRCGKQRVEAYQILNAIRDRSGWFPHPAVQMWVGYTEALKLYMNAAIEEWVRRGYVNNMKLARVRRSRLVLPPWIGNRRFHSRMRARLLAKDPRHYRRFGWSERPRHQGYLWPRVLTDGTVIWADGRRL